MKPIKKAINYNTINITEKGNSTETKISKFTKNTAFL
jgi:hypothetical protein